ncbi:unnamed protein product [Urochloa humidicola]
MGGYQSPRHMSQGAMAREGEGGDDMVAGLSARRLRGAALRTGGHSGGAAEQGGAGRGFRSGAMVPRRTGLARRHWTQRSCGAACQCSAWCWCGAARLPSPSCGRATRGSWLACWCLAQRRCPSTSFPSHLATAAIPPLLLV